MKNTVTGAVLGGVLFFQEFLRHWFLYLALPEVRPSLLPPFLAHSLAH
jgi:hypothetical protein